MRTYLIAFTLSLLVALILTPLLRDFAIRMKWVDIPDERKIHTKPIPRIGGIAILIAASVPLLGMAFWTNRLSRMFLEDTNLIWSLLGGGGLIAFVGILDDLFNIRARYKLLGQIGAGLIVFAFGMKISCISVPFLGVVCFPDWISLGITVFWVTLVINAINLIDGMDGLAGSVVTLAGLSLFVMSVMEGNLLAALLLISFVGGTIGFLAYNLNPASVFLGDTGSMSLGFVLSLTAIHSSQKSYTIFSMIAAIMVLGLPIFDLSMAIVRRFLSGKPIFGADQYHIHHILLRKGFSQRQSVLLLFAFALALESLAFISIYADDRMAALSIIAIIPIGVVAMRFLGYGSIISQSRRKKSLEDIQHKASALLTKNQEWLECCDDSSVISFCESLIDHADELKWSYFSITHSDSVIFCYPLTEPKENIQDKTINHYSLCGGYTLEVRQLFENELLTAFAQALQLLVVQRMKIVLTQELASSLKDAH
jgi:UDP-GlcNAc:undecaprenyl-phosphate GlcNAc-1-phosphate transferase